MATYSEQDKANLSEKRGKLAAGITDPSQRKAFLSAQGEADRKGGRDQDYAPVVQDTTAEGNRQALSAALGSFKHGGTVHKTGLYKLHEGEHVEPKHWIQKMHMKKGAYGHHSLKQIHKDEKKGGKIGKRANLAETLRSFHHEK